MTLSLLVTNITLFIDSVWLKVQLAEGDIETILNTLVFDGKAEMSLVADSSSGSSSNGQRKLFRVLRPLLPVTGLMRTPCGVCPVRHYLPVSKFPLSKF